MCSLQVDEMAEDLRHEIIQYTINHHKKTGKIPTIRQLSEKFGDKGVNRSSFYHFFPEGLSELCVGAGLQPPERLKRTLRATEARREGLVQPQFVTQEMLEKVMEGLRSEILGGAGGGEELPTPPPPESFEIGEASAKQMGTWVKAKNLVFFDFARQGAFGGPLDDFDGNWSDFVNIVIEAYFSRMGVGVGIMSRRLAP